MSNNNVESLDEQWAADEAFNNASGESSESDFSEDESVAPAVSASASEIIAQQKQKRDSAFAQVRTIRGSKPAGKRGAVEMDRSIHCNSLEGQETRTMTARKRQKLADLKSSCKQKNAARRGPSDSHLTLEPKDLAAYFWKSISAQRRSSGVAAAMALTPLEGECVMDLRDARRGETHLHSVMTSKDGGVPYSQKWKWKPEKKHKPGSPVILVVCADAVRCCDVLRALKPKFKCQKGKLFAKHVKLEEHVSKLAKSPMPIAVGTPDRCEKLASLNALKLHRLKLLVVDMHKNKKGFSVMDLKEVRTAFAKFYLTHLHGLVTSKKVKLALF